MFYNHKLIKKYPAGLALLLLLGNASELSSKGHARLKATPTSPLVKPGQCKLPDGSIAPDISTTIRLSESQGIWSVAMETLGSNSAGSWFINFTKNGVGEPSTQYEFNPPGGWAIVGSSIAKGEKKGGYQFIAKATKNSNPVIVCESSVAMKKR